MILLTFKDDRFYGKIADAKHFAPPEGNALPAFYEALDCDTVDVVPLHNGGKNIDMWVDDEATINGDPIPNPYATALRTIAYANSGGDIANPASMPPICGRVILTGCGKDGEMLDLNDEQVAWVCSLLGLDEQEMKGAK